MKLTSRLSVRRRLLALTGLSALMGAALIALPTTAHAAVTCGVTYTASNWGGGGGFTANLTINNTGDPVNGWTLQFTFPGGQQITQPGWGATYTQSGNQVTATPLSWNANLPTGGSTQIGFNGTSSGTNSPPTSFSINNTTCNGGGGGNQAPSVSLTSPTSGASFPAGAAIPLAATASDPDGTVNRVEFLIDGTMVGSDTTSPYSFSAPGVSSGSHTAQARAVDNGSPAQSTTTSAATFTVGGGGGTPAVVASPNPVSLVEGGSTTLNIRLSQAPTGSVNVTLTKTGDTNITVSPTSITLTTSNWNTGVNVTVSAAEDTDTTADTASIAAAGSGVTSVTVPITATDNDGTGGGGHAENPYAGATGYASPDYAAKLEDSAATAGGTTATRIRSLKTVKTAVWLDRIGAIDPPDAMGLRDHLDAALTQKQGNTPIVAEFVVYDLPNRDCAALASNGELLISQNGLNRYKTEYIDPIASIVTDPKYAGIRIVLVVEPDSLPNLVTNLSTPACAEANSTGAYVEGMRYAISKLTVQDNAYLYLDIAHSGWLGWSSNFNPAVDRYIQMLNSPGPGLSSVDGFITNTANYTPVEEPFLPNSNLQVGGGQVMDSTFYEFNPYFDERDFATDLRNAFVSRGMPAGTGMLIDTGRNGWGGSGRPTAVSTSTDRNTYVNESKIDRRPHRGGWCNQAGAGVGARPTASPFAGVDAFVWVKPPGESDGISEPNFTPDPNDPNKKHDPMCDPNAQNRYNSAFSTNALDNAPHAGRWFHDQLVMLVNNAFPAL